ncbi:MAG: hypothetical protein OXD49_15905 [Candidatus Poribacteria bacterium]|nr:hypothetical protein [Candidatus Poribacteria bacterium]
MQKYEGYVCTIIVAISLLVMFSGCSVKSLLQQRAPVKAEIVRRADWEVEFRAWYYCAGCARHYSQAKIRDAILDSIQEKSY